ncbi:MAG TPA: hypothetical protein VK121_11605 [Pseudogracilibacillus sp.]|nr:hypothetical protein [Pseudogracilibacillus sp.]
MDFQKRKLYHQIHPLKLLTDWITGVIYFTFCGFIIILIGWFRGKVGTK